MKEERDSLLKSLYSDTGVYVMYGLYAVLILVIIGLIGRSVNPFNIFSEIKIYCILGAIIGLMYMIQYLVLSEEYRSNDQDIVLFSVAISLLYTLYQVVPNSGNVSVEEVN